MYDKFIGNVKITLEKLDNGYFGTMPYRVKIYYDEMCILEAGFIEYEKALDRVKVEYEREACRLAYLMDRSVVESCKIG